VRLNTDFVGRVFKGEPYEVSRVKIAEFANAIGETSELCLDKAAAQRAGYPDVIAPPTFARTIAERVTEPVHHDPELGVDYSMIVHLEQSFRHDRPLHAGDVVVATTTVESIKQVGSVWLVVTATDINTTDGEYVGTTWSTLAQRP
jgi:acyl dehydratase